MGESCGKFMDMPSGGLKDGKMGNSQCKMEVSSWEHLYQSTSLPCLIASQGAWLMIPFGKRLHNYGKSPCWMRQFTIPIAIFNRFTIQWGYLIRDISNVLGWVSADRISRRTNPSTDYGHIFGSVRVYLCILMYIYIYIHAIYVHMYNPFFLLLNPPPPP